MNKAKIRSRPSRRRLRGQTIVEFTLVLLMVLTVVFGVVELSRMLLTYNALAEAARIGVRYASVHGGTRSGSGVDGPSGPGCDATPPGGSSVAPNVVNAVSGSAAGISAAALTVSVCYPDGQNTAGKRVRIIAFFNYVPTIRFLPFASSITLSSTTQGTICY